MHAILIVDDEPVVLEVLCSALEAPERTVLRASNVQEALQIADENDIDVAILDKNLGSGSGLELLRLLRAAQPDIEAIVITGYSTIDSAVEALRAHAFDYLTKPFDPDEIADKVAAALVRVDFKRQRLERTRQLYKMESIGVLAASIGHEINNPLTYVIGNLEYLSNRLSDLELGTNDTNDLSSVIDDAREGADRVRAIVRELRMFSRSYREEKTQRVSVLECLASSARLVENEIRHRATLVRQFGEVPHVAGSPIRLSQVFVNILMNAVQAISPGDVAGNTVEVICRTNDVGDVVITVRDTGVGIPSEDLPRVFDRFFTTKGHEGMGLGLSITRRFIEENNGTIDVDSKVGEGTLVTIVLPPAPSVAEPVTQPAKVELSAGGRLLIIDDDRQVGRTFERGLEGHEVVVVTCGREALELLATDTDFDVVLCDIMMPDVGGAEVHAELLRTNPELAREVIFMTGGAFTGPAREFEDRTENRIIEKPISIRDIRSLLGARVAQRQKQS